MTDRLDGQQRSQLMARVRCKDTAPEMAVRRMLHALGYRYRLHVTDLPGRPDIVLPRHRKVIQVHGCFWHSHPGCRKAKAPSSNESFWSDKLAANVARDARNEQALRSGGWSLMTVWECEVKDLAELERRLRAFLET